MLASAAIGATLQVPWNWMDCSEQLCPRRQWCPRGLLDRSTSRMIVSECDKLFAPEFQRSMQHDRAVTAHVTETHGDRERRTKSFLRFTCHFKRASPVTGRAGTRRTRRSVPRGRALRARSRVSDSGFYTAPEPDLQSKVWREASSNPRAGPDLTGPSSARYRVR